ncbi:hypothetical protein IC232_26270 [Microvirga sp. BT688]|uniref:GumC family protein n=1 Tax=Microvirga sp. TaxID=1873136 RepID=UPI001687F3D8|nr:hypothetical protein [Microvirga sp.]MBD2750176.1 hypothetical protein [Microvirga sp.]
MEQVNSRGLQYYLGLLKRKFLFLLIPALLVAVSGTMVVLSLNRIYRAEAAMIVEPQRIPTSGESSNSANPGEALQLAEQRALTRANLARLAEDFDLFPALRRTKSQAEIADLMRERLKVERISVGPGARPMNSPTFFFTVAFDYEDPDVAAGVVDKVVTALLEADVQTRVGKASDAVQLLGREVKRLSNEIEAIEAQVSDFTRKNIGVLPGRLDFQLTQIEAKRTELSENDASIRALDEERRLLDFELRLKASAWGAAGENQGAGGRLQTLREELAGKASLYSDTHPEIRTLKQQIALLEEQIQAALSEINAGGQVDPSSLPPDLRLVAERIKMLDTRRSFLSQRREEISRTINTLERGITQAPEVEAVLRTLQGQREAVRRSLDELTARLAAAELMERLEKDERAKPIRLIEPPVVPDFPVKPNLMKYMILVLGVAGASGLGTLLAIDLLDRTIRNSAEIRAIAGEIPIACIPYITTHQERRKRKANVVFGVASVCALTLTGLVGVHMYILPAEQALERLEAIYR